MARVWLQSNRRSLAITGPLPAGAAALAWAAWQAGPTGPCVTAATTAAILAAAALAWGAWRLSLGPRLAVRGRTLLAFVRWGRPCAIPLEDVECLFIASGRSAEDSRWPSRWRSHCLVLRLGGQSAARTACRAGRWLGTWQPGYLAIDGAWTEPLTADLLKRLAGRLAAARDARAGVHQDGTFGGTPL